MHTAVRHHFPQHATQQPLTVAQYLERDAAAERRSEYVQGKMIPMAGATRSHVRIVSNLVQHLQNQTEGRECDVFSNDTRVRAANYYYPDVGVVCGDYLVDTLQIDTLTNPTVLVEVLSDSTESIDRGVKLRHYLRLPSLRSYLLVSQYYPIVEQYERSEATKEWRFIEIEGLDAVVEVPAIECRLTMSDIYRRVPLLDLRELDTEPGDMPLKAVSEE